MSQQTGGEVFAQSLIAQGVDTLFMIPGVQLDWAVEALRQVADRINLVVPRHEQTTTYMADGYYRASGKPGVAMVVPGPGVLNATAGLATAYASNSKVVMLAGQIHRDAIGKGHGLLHEIRNQTDILANLTKWNTNVAEVADIPVQMAQAFAQLHQGRPRPTAIEISHSLFEEHVSGVAGAPAMAPAATPELDVAGLKRVAELLTTARMPLLYVGGGVLSDAASEALRGFVEHSGIPVVMSDNGLGALPDHAPLAFNALAGRALFEHADLVVVIGSRFIDSLMPKVSWSAPSPRIAYINIDRADLGAPRVAEATVCADAASALTWLHEHVPARELLTSAEASSVKAWAQDQIDRVSPQADYLREMRRALPEDGIFVNELTQVGYLARVAWPVYATRTYIGPGYQGTLGYGFPTALGAAVGGGGRRVLSITGDGGFGWNLQELATARKYRLPVTLVVFNDGHFGNVRDIQQRVFGANVAVDLQNPDFQLLAQAFGVPSVRVDNAVDLGAAVRNSLSEEGPVLIEVEVGKMPSPWSLLRLEPMAGTAAEAPPNPLVRKGS